MQNNKLARPTAEEAQKWANALRSGKYKQTRARLQTNEGHCCLGVACEIFGTRLKRKSGKLKGFMPANQTDMGADIPKWLFDIGEDCWVVQEVNGNMLAKNICSLNDEYNLTFDEIADCIEAVYIYKALEPS